jgi:hypothetical protein
MNTLIKDWVSLVRGGGKFMPPVPLETPLMVVIDSYSKLMTQQEANGEYDYGKNMSADAKKKSKEIGQGSNFGHAKWTHEWARRLPAFQDKNNLNIIVVSHQNDKLDMSGTPPAILARMGQSDNKSKIGGRALNQNASIQLVLDRKGNIKNKTTNRAIGSRVKVKAVKNSYGPKERDIEYDIYFDEHDDTEEMMAPSISFDRGMCEKFADLKIINTKVEKGLYSSDVLGVSNVTAEEFSQAFHENKPIMNAVGRSLKIHGYDRIVDEIIEEETNNTEEDTIE